MKLNAICHNCFEFVFPGYWHFENGVRKVSEDVLMDYLMSLLLLSPCLHFWLDGQRRSFLVPNYSTSKS